MKARLQRHHTLESGFGSISHLIALGGERAVALSRYSRRVARIAGGDVDVIALDPKGETQGDLFDRRGAAFALGDGFAVAFADRLAVFDHFLAAPRVLPLRFEDVEQASAQGRLDPVIACASGAGRAVLGLHARALSIHSAARIVDLVWDEHEAVVLSGARWFHPATVPGAEATRDPADESHPPVIQALASDAQGGLYAQSTGPGCNHARYGMYWCAIGGWDSTGRSRPATRIPEGYGAFDGASIWLRALKAKAGGLDFVRCGFDGEVQATLRITKKALSPVEDQWLEFAFGGSDLWFGDDFGRIAQFSLS